MDNGLQGACALQAIFLCPGEVACSKKKRNFAYQFPGMKWPKRILLLN